MRPGRWSVEKRNRGSSPTPHTWLSRPMAFPPGSRPATLAGKARGVRSGSGSADHRASPRWDRGTGRGVA